MRQYLRAIWEYLPQLALYWLAMNRDRLHGYLASFVAFMVAVFALYRFLEGDNVAALCAVGAIGCGIAILRAV